MFGMRDHHVRSALRAVLAEEHRAYAEDTLVVDELDLCGYVRVDIAVLNGSLSGFELKSQQDNLKRLPCQVEFYSRVLDYATLVVAENHQASALELIPSWWGHMTARWIDGRVVLDDVRSPALNPDPDPVSMALLLWREEALEELTTRGRDRGVRGRTRRDVCARLAESLEVSELRDVVRERMKARTNWRANISGLS